MLINTRKHDKNIEACCSVLFVFAVDAGRMEF